MVWKLLEVIARCMKSEPDRKQVVARLGVVESDGDLSLLPQEL